MPAAGLQNMVNDDFVPRCRHWSTCSNGL